mgnify:CR=1 FL=1
MILDRLLRHHPKSREGNIKFFLVLLAFVCVAAVMVRLVQWVIPDKPTPLLLQEDGVIQTSSFEDAKTKTETLLWLPEDLFGSEIFVVGIYPKQTDHVSAGTVIVVLKKETWRTGQIVYLPGVTLGEERAKYLTTKVEEIVIEGKTGYLLPIQGVLPLCKTNVEGFPGTCQFTNIILFEAGSEVITIASDNGKITQGELIAMARSIAKQATQSVSVDAPVSQ